MKTTELLNIGTNQLNNRQIAKLLLKEYLNISENEIVLNNILDETLITKYFGGLERLKNGEPIQYIIGETNFYGYQFKVNNKVLIPRFETEGLVQNVIEYAKNNFINPRIIDLGCGSGAIGITIKKELPLSEVTCLDIDKHATKLTLENALRLDATIKVIKGDMLNNIDEKFDIIVSNPPYIGKDEQIEKLVFDNEPHLALFANNNGLAFYEQILKKAEQNLNQKSIIAFEIGYKQASAIIEIGKEYFPKAAYIVKKDLSNKNRYVFILNNI